MGIMSQGGLFQKPFPVNAAEVAFSDTPYQVTSSDDRIYVDATAGNVVVNLLNLLLAPKKPIHIQKVDASANTVTINADSPDTINGFPSKIISSQDVDHELVPINEWRLS